MKRYLRHKMTYSYKKTIKYINFSFKRLWFRKNVLLENCFDIYITNQISFMLILKLRGPFYEIP